MMLTPATGESTKGSFHRALASWGEGYDHRLGTRPLQHVIEKRVAVPLVRWRVSHPKAIGVTLHVTLNNQGHVTVNG